VTTPGGEPRTVLTASHCLSSMVTTILPIFY
jgi:hypothetical protein